MDNDNGDLLDICIDDAAIIGAFINTVCSSVIIWAEAYMIKQPIHTSAPSGLAWVDELIDGHPDRIKTALGVSLPIFKGLLSTLRKLGYKNSKHVKLREQLAIFLHTCVTGLSIRHVAERFLRSNGTISVCVCSVYYRGSLSHQRHYRCFSPNVSSFFLSTILHKIRPPPEEH